MFSCFCHIALYTCSTIDSLLSNSINARERKRPFVPTSNDDDVIKNYITDMDLGEDSDSMSNSAYAPVEHLKIYTLSRKKKIFK